MSGPYVSVYLPRRYVPLYLKPHQTATLNLMKPRPYKVTVEFSAEKGKKGLWLVRKNDQLAQLVISKNIELCWMKWWTGTPQLNVLNLSILKQQPQQQQQQQQTNKSEKTPVFTCKACVFKFVFQHGEV